MALAPLRAEVDRRGEALARSFTSPLHDQRTAALLGMALGVGFLTSFATGLLSHLIQQPPSWFSWPARPAGTYRITQGLHVATGLALIPLTLAKLWVVYPHFWGWPAVRNVAHAVERISLLPLVGGSLFLLFTGTGNIARWRPWNFDFVAGHYWAAWITIGAIVVHVFTKWGITSTVLLGRRLAAAVPPAVSDRLSRRGLLLAAGGTSALITLATVGQTIRPLRRLSVLAPRIPTTGPQGLPVNKTARSARVEELAMDPAWRLRVAGAVDRPLSLSLTDLRALPQVEVSLPITCVEGWSAQALWKGVRVRDLLDQAGAARTASADAVSLQTGSRYATSPLNADQLRDADTVIALEVNGEVLNLDHGFPARLIGPNRPGVQQTKWLSVLEVR